MSQEPIVACTIVNGVGHLLGKYGISFEDTLQDVDLNLCDISEDENTVPLRTFARFFELAAEKADSKTLGMDLAANLDPGATGVHGYAAMHAPTVRDSIITLARYSRLLTSLSASEYAEREGVGVGTWSFSGGQTHMRQYSEFVAARLVYRLRLALGDSWVPFFFDLEHSEPENMGPFLKVFGPQLRFNQPLNRIGVKVEDLDREMPLSDPRLWRLLMELGEGLLVDSKTELDMAQRVRREILESLPHDVVTVDSVAKRLGKSVRSLQRDLDGVGTNFAVILDGTRVELAERYLGSTDLNITQIAYLLGFSELSAFTRATNRWFGEPPRSRRQRLRSESGCTKNKT